MERYIKSPVNYIGNKFKLLPQIIPLFPKGIHTFYDVFGGSGTVLLNVEAESYVYNDLNCYVAEILKGMLSQSADETIAGIKALITEYGLSKTNKVGFEQIRADYNKGRSDWLTLYTLMCYSFNYQFRFNSEHKYNSSFGKDRSSFSSRQESNIHKVVDKLKGKQIQITGVDFRGIDFSKVSTQDFLYFDPPYLYSVGSYNDGKRGFEGWTQDHEISLLGLLTELNRKNVHFALSNNLKYENEYLTNWLKSNSAYKVHYLQADYSNCSYHKAKQGDDIEVLITNY